MSENGIRHVDVEGLPKGGPYSNAVTAGKMAFLSGLTGQSESNRSFADQFRSISEKLERVLKACNSSINSVVKVTAYLKHGNDFQEFNSLFSELFKQRPARTTVVAGFAADDILVELDVIALKED